MLVRESRRNRALRVSCSRSPTSVHRSRYLAPDCNSKCFPLHSSRPVLSVSGCQISLLHRSKMAHHHDAGDPKTAHGFKHSACNSCRKRKLRCNGARPVCRTCETNNRECDWEDTMRKPGPRRGYVRSIEARLGALSPFPPLTVDI